MSWNSKHSTTVVTVDGHRRTYFFRCSCGRVGGTVASKGLAMKMSRDHRTYGLRRHR